MCLICWLRHSWQTLSTLRVGALPNDWADIQSPFPRRNATSEIATLEERIESFNIELANRLAELQPKASEILRQVWT